MHPHRTARLQFTYGAFLVAVVLAGCGGADRAGDEAVVRDSAGIRIVENGEVAGQMAPFRISDEPVWRIGWEAGDPEFGGIRDGVLLSGGGVAVTDGQSRQIFFLSPSGEIEAILGGPGQGPGEFGSLASTMRLAGDTVAVQDLGNQRVNLFHGGELVGSAAGPREMLAWSFAFGVDPDGRLLLGLPFGFSPNFPEPWLRLPIMRQDLATGVIDTIASFGWIQNAEDRAGNPFSAVGSVAASRGMPVVGRGDIPKLRWFDGEGRVQQIARWSAERRPVTDAFWDAYAEAYGARLSANLPDDSVQARLARSRLAARQPLPHFRGLEGDSDGRVWLAEYGPDFRFVARFDVLSPDGEWLGTVEMPPRFQVLDIHDGFVLGIERDAFDVEAVAVYRIEEG